MIYNLVYILIGACLTVISLAVYGGIERKKASKKIENIHRVDINLDETFKKSIDGIYLEVKEIWKTMRDIRMGIDVQGRVLEDIGNGLLNPPQVIKQKEWEAPQLKHVKDYVHYLEYSRDAFAKTKEDKEVIQKIIHNIKKQNGIKN